MQIVRKDILPDGIQIQLEDWSEYNTSEYPDVYGMQIGAYPIAKNHGYFIRAGERFRLTIAHNPYKGYTNAAVAADYTALVNGEKKLEDLVEYFWDGKKDAWRLGIV